MTRTAPSLPILADMHTHTLHSHGQATSAAMFESACTKGLRYFGFSEHSPRPIGYTYACDYQEKLIREFPDYIREVHELTALGKGRDITVLLGIEIDYIAEQEAFAAALCKEYAYDYVIGGLHFQGTWGFDGSATDWEGLSLPQRFAVYARYYQDLARMCRTGFFNIAAHPDLVKIHSAASFNLWLETPEALPLVENALIAMKEAGMAMEVSSAGLRKTCKEIYPGPRIMALAAKLELPICFGSDAHCADTPAYAFDALARYAHSFGYRSSVFFVQKAPRSLPFTLSPPL